MPTPEPRTGTGALHLIVDSTGLKFHGPGEWLANAAVVAPPRSTAVESATAETNAP